MNAVKPVIVGLGEVLWDVFPDGPRFGGAPANYACHAASLGASSHLVSAVGRDELGKRALLALHNHGVDASVVQQNGYRTGAVHIQLDAAGKASYEFLDNVAWDHLEWSARLGELAARTDAVCFGTLGQRAHESQQTIHRYVTATPASCLRIFDINLRPPFYADDTILQSMEIANVLKLNDDELPIVAKLCGLAGTEREIMQSLARRFDLQLVALTRGAHGALLVRGDQVSDHPGVATSIIDTVGAGDSFTAAITLGLLAGHNLEAINDQASRVAAFVCSQAGATPRLPMTIVVP
ncbi:MAG TPA: carbohydrate kinase [Pirellulaceae bacterium]|nr:carbohydrate kinase [Pirellulaceae bacterium]